MKFCDKCDNMYYMKLSSDEGTDIILYCRRCGNEDDDVDNGSCVISTSTDNIDQSNLHINKYTKHDPTLPHTANIACPNTECSTNTGATPRDVLYVRYDDNDLKYVYMCSVCDSIWNMKKN